MNHDMRHTSMMYDAGVTFYDDVSTIYALFKNYNITLNIAPVISF